MIGCWFDSRSFSICERGVRVGYAQAFQRVRGSPRRDCRKGQEDGGGCREILTTGLVDLRRRRHAADVIYALEIRSVSVLGREQGFLAEDRVCGEVILGRWPSGGVEQAADTPSQLPDFVLSIEVNYGQTHEPTIQPGGQPPTSETSSLVPGLPPPLSPPQRPLRYDAYESPPPARRLATRSPVQNRSRSSASARSSSQLSVDSLSSDYVDPEMAKTMTPGELALMPSEVRNLNYSPFLNVNLEVDHLVSPTQPQPVNVLH